MLAVVLQDGRSARIPLQNTVTDFRAPGLVYHLDSTQIPKNVEAGHGVRQALIKQLGQLYQSGFRYVVLLGLIAVAVRAGRILIRRKGLRWWDHVVLACSVVVSVVGLVAILAVISTYSFPTYNAEYMGAMVPLVLFAAAFSIAEEAGILHRLLQRWARKRGGVTPIL